MRRNRAVQLRRAPAGEKAAGPGFVMKARPVLVSATRTVGKGEPFGYAAPLSAPAAPPQARPGRLRPAPLSFGSEIAPLRAFALRPFPGGSRLAYGPRNHPHTARPLNRRASRPAGAFNRGKAVGLSAGQNA